MARLYIDADEVRITRIDDGTLNVEFYTGEKMENLEPRRLFPSSGRTRYISLVNEENKEQAIIRDLDTLMPDSKKAVEDCLNEFYLIPKVLKISSIDDRAGELTLRVVTDHGPRSFKISSPLANMKLLFDGRLLMRDMNDNRYEVDNVNELDKVSRMLLNRYI